MLYCLWMPASFANDINLFSWPWVWFHIKFGLWLEWIRTMILMLFSVLLQGKTCCIVLEIYLSMILHFRNETLWLTKKSRYNCWEGHYVRDIVASLVSWDMLWKREFALEEADPFLSERTLFQKSLLTVRANRKSEMNPLKWQKTTKYMNFPCYLSFNKTLIWKQFCWDKIISTLLTSIQTEIIILKLICVQYT